MMKEDKKENPFMYAREPSQYRGIIMTISYQLSKFGRNAADNNLLTGLCLSGDLHAVLVKQSQKIITLMSEII